jgi:hypothetical protein
VLFKLLVIFNHTNFQEIIPPVVDARDVTGHLKFLTQSPRTDVLLDQDHNANVMKDMEIQDTHASHAHSVKSEVELTKLNVLIHQLALEQIKFNLLSTPLLVEDARLVNGQDLLQMSPELSVLPDHLLSVPIAQPDNLLMDTLVSNAQLDKL